MESEAPSVSSEHEPELVERVETTRFLGTEFLAWLWFKAEALEATIKRADGSPMELWLDSSLELRSMSDAAERIVFRGVAPTATPEAKLSLSQNKWPVRARITITYEGQEFSFTFDAPTYSLAAVKLPQVINDDSHEAYLERLRLLELLFTLLDEQYEEFLTVRLSPLWDGEVIELLRAWLSKAELPSARALAGLVRRAR